MVLQPDCKTLSRKGVVHPHVGRHTGSPRRMGRRFDSQLEGALPAGLVAPFSTLLAAGGIVHCKSKPVGWYQALYSGLNGRCCEKLEYWVP